MYIVMHFYFLLFFLLEDSSTVTANCGALLKIKLK